MPAVSPYLTAAKMGRAAPGHVAEDAGDDRQRVTAYETYEDMYHNVPDIFVAVMAVDDSDSKYQRLIPSSRSIIEGTNRYLAQGLSWVATAPTPTAATDPAAQASAEDGGADAVIDEQIRLTMEPLNALLTREAFASKWLSIKRWTLVRGDGMIHLTADPAKPEGTRIRITELQPNTYFHIEDPVDAERVLGCYIVNIVKDDEGEEIAARLEYQRILTDEDAARFPNSAVGGVWRRLSFFEVGNWDDRAQYGLSEEDLSPVDVPTRYTGEAMAPLLAGEMLPAPISALPVYHFRNRRRGGKVFGVSELQGLETIITGVNQTVTDEDLAVAMAGLGVYVTDSGPPTDPLTQQSVPFIVGPASVMEVEPGTKFERVQGVTSVQASQGHAALLKAEMRETSGTPDIAVGTNGRQVASSGVALRLEFAPVISKNLETEEEFKTVLAQFLYDLLNGWMPAYEGYTPNGVTVTAEFEDALPVNEPELVEMVNAMVQAKTISAATGRQILTERLGWTFPADESTLITGEASALLDAEGARLGQDAEPAAGAGPDEDGALL